MSPSRKYHREYMWEVHPWRYWKEQEPGMSFIPTTTTWVFWLAVTNVSPNMSPLCHHIPLKWVHQVSFQLDFYPRSQWNWAKPQPRWTRRGSTHVCRSFITVKLLTLRYLDVESLALFCKNLGRQLTEMCRGMFLINIAVLQQVESTVISGKTMSTVNSKCES